MGDLAPRPRGGWQVGTQLARLRRQLVEEPANDPAPDVYAVERTAEGFVVRHYPSDAAETPCCVMGVTRQEGESDVDALARAARHCDRKHGATGQPSLK